VSPPIRIQTLTPEWFASAEQLQRDCYPTLDPRELMRAEHFRVQHRVFAAGQFIAVQRPHGAVPRAVGMGSGFYCDFDFNHPGHRFRDFCDQLYFRNHNPAGDWYYGADICVHPDHRGKGIGRLLYQARQDRVHRDGKRGIVAGGLIPGFADHKATMSVRDYVEAVVQGRLTDPTLSFQLRHGFEVRGLIKNYLDDAASDNWATLIVWEA
jgi:GNAT superfamily N-acetyltransferase